MNIEEILKGANSKSDACKKLGLPANRWGLNKVKGYCEEYNIEIKRKFYRKNALIEKVCPICSKTFTTTKIKKEKTTCSKSCSNTMFRSGENHANFKKFSYKRLCFDNHKKECVVCQESNIVAVHHYDNNHQNDAIDNLVPLCPTHHQYIHTKKLVHLVQEIVDEYIRKFKQRFEPVV